MAASIVAAAIAAGVGIYNAVKGAKQKKAARALADQNKRPVYNISPTEYDNQRLAQIMASQGMSDAAKDQATRQYDRGLTSSINAILQGGGNPNDVANAYNVYDTHAGQLALADDDIRRANIARLMNQNQRMSDNYDKVFQINKYAPYADTAARAQALYAQGDQQMQSGINQTASAIGSGVGAYGRMVDTKKAMGGYNDIGASPTPGASAYSASNPLTQTYINNNSASMSIYDPRTNSYMRSLDWTKIKPENRQAIYNMLNTRYGSGDQNDVLVNNGAQTPQY